MLILLEALCVVAAIVFVLQYMWRLILNYSITEAGVEISLCGAIRLKRISFESIAEIRRVSIIQCHSGVGLRNRAIAPTVLIRQKRGIIRDFYITPDDADRFVQEVLRRLPD